MNPTKHLLSLDPVMQMVEAGLAQLPLWIQFHINIQEYLNYLLEWLSVRIEDEYATSASDLAAAYLRRNHVPEAFAKEMSHAAMDTLLSTITSALPLVTYHELSIARYVLEDPVTLAVYLPMRALCTS